MSDNPKEAEKEMEKAIFIAADCWLKVFGLLPRSQLGLGIAMISRRFDYYVDEHFKTRKWAFDILQIRGKTRENGAKEMEIVTFDEKELPIPQNPLPNKFIGFGGIWIYYFDQNVITFLGHFHRFFAKCATKLAIRTENIRILEFLLLSIWPMFKDTIRLMDLNSIAFRQIRQFAPLMLNDCPSLHAVKFDGGILPEFPPDDSANASDGQAVAKWLFTPRHDNFPKLLFIKITFVEQWLATMEQIKAEFSAASSPVNFVIFVGFSSSSPIDSVVPFELTNEFTGEKLELAQVEEKGFILVRCPIALAEEKCGNEMAESLNGQKNKKIGVAVSKDIVLICYYDPNSTMAIHHMQHEWQKCYIG